MFWTVAMVVLGIMRFYGVDQDAGINISKGFEDIIPMPKILPFFALLGATMGLIYASLEYGFDSLTSKRISIGLRALIKIFLYFLLIIILATLLIELVTNVFDIELDNGRGWWRTDKAFRAIVLYIFLSAMFFSFIKISNERFGKGVFLKMLLGKYKKPIEEYRIFIFLDLQSSTTIAEAWGIINTANSYKIAFMT